MINNLQQEYIIDKNYIYKNPFEELKELFKENEKIKILTNPKYVQIAFQIAKELNKEDIAFLDEDLKIERDFKESKREIEIKIMKIIIYMIYSKKIPRKVVMMI